MDNWEKKKVYRVYYVYEDGKSGEAFFTEENPAKAFTALLKASIKGVVASVNRWRWDIAVEP
jgi:hypothetical protein